MTNSQIIKDVFKDKSKKYDHIAANKYLLRDGLTGLPCRDSFVKKCEQTFTKAGNGNRAALHIIRIENIRDIVMEHGLHIGEGVLKIVASRLYGLFHADRLFARLDDDKFGLLQHGISHDGQALYTARRIFEHLKEPLEIFQNPVQVAARSGIVFCPDHGRRWDALYRQAVRAIEENQYRPGYNDFIRKL